MLSGRSQMIRQHHMCNCRSFCSPVPKRPTQIEDVAHNPRRATSSPRSLSRMSSASRFSVQMRDVFVPAENVLADPAAEYIYRIRSGFILLQAGMGMGFIRDCISSMR